MAGFGCPPRAIQRLINNGQIDVVRDDWFKEWWNTYRQRRLETKEPDATAFEKKAASVVEMPPRGARKKTS
jgi:hypothetical protein